jgi:hypothetical protein
MENVSEIPLSANKPNIVGYSIIQATLEAYVGGSWCKATPGQKVRPYLKNN